MKNIICLGEIMLRLSPASNFRLTQSLPGKLDATFAGAEANVAVTVAQLGGKASFVSAFPDNQITHSCIANLRSAGVDTSKIILKPDGRFGTFFLENGFGMRGGNVIYDRLNSSFAITPACEYSWDDIFNDASYFHISGITPAISANAAELSKQALMSAKNKGLKTSYDINHRRKLWQWDNSLNADALAKKTHLENLPFVDMVIGNPYDLAMLLKKSPNPENLNPLTADIKDFKDLAKSLAHEHPNLAQIVITLRQTHTASKNSFGALLYSVADDECAISPLEKGGEFSPYNIENILDRVGTGDTFTGALIRSLASDDFTSYQKSLDYATAAAALAHTVCGDYPYLAHAEVLALAKGDSSANLSR